jgi:hypothetical protein
MPRLTSWNDRTFYSIEHDCEVGRISGYDDNNQEFWIVVEAGRGYREKRDAAVIKIMEAIERGDDAGEVLEDE